MNTREVIRKVKKIEIRTRMLVEGLIQGNYHSVFKGRGIEFNEVREYEPGDDIRAIDWNVTARMNTPYVKEFIEERDLTVYILFDASASGNFGDEKEKRETAAELSATLMFAAIRNNDRVGLGIFTDRIERFIPARKGRKHILKLLSEMIAHEPKSKTTSLKAALNYINSIIKKRSIIFVVSDFIDQNYDKPLAHLSRKHDVIAVQIADHREAEIPDVGYILLEDPETGEQVLVDTSDEEFRKAYRKDASGQRKGTEIQTRKASCDLVTINNSGDYVMPLKRFFRDRMRRMAR